MCLHRSYAVFQLKRERLRRMSINDAHMVFWEILFQRPPYRLLLESSRNTQCRRLQEPSHTKSMQMLSKLR
jgi:hypothetical protein